MPESVPPAQVGTTAIVGNALTAIDKVLVVAHCPVDGVKVYIVVAALLIAVAQVPVMTGVLVEDVGKAEILAPAQNGPTAANVGSIADVMVKVADPTQLFTSV